MIGSTLLSFVAGLVTILNPCVLPLVPILVASALGKSKAGPLAGNHFISLTSNLDRLPALGEATLWRGAQPIRFRAAG